MDITEQFLTPEQIKRGFALDKQTNGVATLSLKGKELAHFAHKKDTTKETIQNVADTLWKAYTLGLQDATRLAHGDKLFDTIGKDII